MAAFCPALIYSPEPAGGSWCGSITPIKATEDLPYLLDDIHHNKPVYMALEAEIRHDPACCKGHCQHLWMEQVRPHSLMRTFDAQVSYSGSRNDPRCWVAGIDRTNCRHMWSDGSICPFLSSSTNWDWMHDTVADFVGHVSVFLIAWMVFQCTGEWIVGEHENSGTYHLSALRPNDRCWCRSGKKYRKCHMQFDQALALRGR